MSSTTRMKRRNHFIIRMLISTVMTLTVSISQVMITSKSEHWLVFANLRASDGSDASLRPLAEGSTTKLAEACRRFLINAQKDFDLRRWAAEGLSFLTIDAEVKEKLAEDEAAIR